MFAPPLTREELEGSGGSRRALAIAVAVAVALAALVRLVG